METFKRLERNRDALLEQYHSNLEDIYNLQDTLIRDILPSVTDELELSPESQEWAKEWLSDTSSIFRISRRNKFTRSFSLEAIQKTLLWRLDNLWPLEPPKSIPNLHCLPSDIRDPLGRPILAVEVVAVDESLDSQKRSIIQAFEQLRLHLKKLYDNSEDDARPPLQYVILLDLRQLSFQSINIDLFTWTVREVIPRFSGLVAAVFMLNYSWTHAGLWGVFKRLLPESALSRVFFPLNSELVQYFSPSALPQEYGGSLPTLSLIEDPMRPKLPFPEVGETTEPPTAASPAVPEPSLISPSWISPTSLLNPFSDTLYRHRQLMALDLSAMAVGGSEILCALYCLSFGCAGTSILPLDCVSRLQRYFLGLGIARAIYDSLEEVSYLGSPINDNIFFLRYVCEPARFPPVDGIRLLRPSYSN